MADLTTSPDAFTEKPVSNENARWRVIWRNAFPFIVVGLIWEAVARAGVFPAKLFPTIETIAAAFWRLTMNGILLHHAFDTIWRLLAGFALSAIGGVAIGILMGRSRRAEDICLPLVSMLAPIPGIAWAPLFLLWFGLGIPSLIFVIIHSVLWAVALNTHTGFMAVSETQRMARSEEHTSLFRS